MGWLIAAIIVIVVVIIIVAIVLALRKSGGSGDGGGDGGCDGDKGVDDPKNPCPPKPEQEKGDLVVTVSDKETGTALAGAAVEINGPETHSATTGPSGQATFSGLTPGGYVIGVNLAKYSRATDSGTVVALTTTPVDIKLEPEHGSLMVSVTEKNTGKAVSGVTVEITGPETHGVSSATNQVMFDKLTPGQYQVSAKNDSYADSPVKGTATVVADQTEQLSLQLTPCTKAEIEEPKGSLSAAANPPACWKTPAPYHFDFQGVLSGCPGAYSLTLRGKVVPAPSYGYKWTLAAAAGTLANDTTATPTHTPAAAAGQGKLTLVGTASGNPASCIDEKEIKIYEDHLARDRENFGIGTNCKGNWTFTRFGVTPPMTHWNCHGGTRHIYNGTGTGSESPARIAFLLQAGRRKRTVTVTHKIAGGGSHPPLGALNRGDIVAYYTAPIGIPAVSQLAHTQTCTGSGTETYGANNKPVNFPGRPNVDEAWEWAASPAGDWANNIKLGLLVGGGVVTPFTIKVFSKP